MTMALVVMARAGAAGSLQPTNFSDFTIGESRGKVTSCSVPAPPAPALWNVRDAAEGGMKAPAPAAAGGIGAESIGDARRCEDRLVPPGNGENGPGVREPHPKPRASARERWSSRTHTPNGKGNRRAGNRAAAIADPKHELGSCNVCRPPPAPVCSLPRAAPRPCARALLSLC